MITNDPKATRPSRADKNRRRKLEEHLFEALSTIRSPDWDAPGAGDTLGVVRHLSQALAIVTDFGGADGGSDAT